MQATQQESPTLQPPTKPGEWTLEQVRAALSRPLPASCLRSKKAGKTQIQYLPWHMAVKILDKYAPGWTWEIVKIATTDERLFLVGRLTVPTAEGNLYREATGTEALRRVDDEGEVKDLAYGDPSSNAESMAFRRAAAKFGLGLYLYEK